jgi:hypothetical protein
MRATHPRRRRGRPRSAGDATLRACGIDGGARRDDDENCAGPPIGNTAYVVGLTGIIVRIENF